VTLPDCNLRYARSESPGYILSRGDKLNISFYMAMIAASEATQMARPSRQKIATIDMKYFSNEIMYEVMMLVHKQYKDLGGDDKTAKSAELGNQLKDHLVTKFSTQRISS
jgi:hypothetical protein